MRVTSSVRWEMGRSWAAALSLVALATLGCTSSASKAGNDDDDSAAARAGSIEGAGRGGGGVGGRAAAGADNGGGESSGGKLPEPGGTGGTSGTEGGDAGSGAETGSGASAGADGVPEPRDCEPGSTRSCADGGLRGACASGTQTCTEDGRFGECSIQPEATDTCARDNDADCDGEPNGNPACDCIEGATRACALGGALGNCAAGTQTCNAAGQFEACDVKPKAADSCDAPGDDATCDGTPNGGCPCVNGQTQACGPEQQGICRRGVSTCANSAWGACVGAVLPTGRDCRSSADNDCDGRADNTLDAVCACRSGMTQVCGEHPGLDGNGPCRAGQRSCSVAADGSSSAWGGCSGSVAPAQADRCTTGDDANCNGTPNEGCECTAGAKSTCGAVHAARGECAPRALTCTAAGRWPAVASCAAAGPELCANDNKDEDCDGQINEAATCACVNGQTRACGGCSAGSQTCVNGAWGACADKLTQASARGPLLRCVSGGDFQMGSARFDESLPIHPVRVASFWMDETEVTVAQYAGCSTAGACPPAETGCQFNTEVTGTHPIGCLDFEPAKDFCEWAGKRLPTEEEWEYAARGSDGRPYPWGTTPPNANLASFFDTSLRLMPVKSYPAGVSPFGLYDMAGNVWEWTSSYFCPYTATGKSNQCGTPIIYRGGSFQSESPTLNSSFRYYDVPPFVSPSLGVRCAKSVP